MITQITLKTSVLPLAKEGKTMSESMDRKVTSNKEQSHAEKGSKEPNRAAQAAITQAANSAAKGDSKS